MKGKKPAFTYFHYFLMSTSFRFTEKTPQAQKLHQLFDRYLTDPTTGVDAHQTTPHYIKNNVYARDQDFQKIPIKTFYAGYRRFANKWVTNQTVAGQRKIKRQRGKLHFFHYIFFMFHL